MEISGIAANTFPLKPDSLFEEDYSSQKFSILLPQFLETVVISWPSTFTFSQTAASITSIFLRKSKSIPDTADIFVAPWSNDFEFWGSFKVFQGSRCLGFSPFPNFPLSYNFWNHCFACWCLSLMQVRWSSGNQLSMHLPICNSLSLPFDAKVRTFQTLWFSFVLRSFIVARMRVGLNAQLWTCECNAQFWCQNLSKTCFPLNFKRGVRQTSDSTEKSVQTPNCLSWDQGWVDVLKPCVYIYIYYLYSYK